MNFLKKIISLLPPSITLGLKKIYYKIAISNVDFKKEINLSALDSLINAGDFVVDIGANFGVYTSYLSKKVKQEGKVVSIEPVPSTFSVLQYLIKKLKMDNVTALQFAISNKEEKVFMEVPNYEAGGLNFYRAKIIDGSSKDSFSVDSTTLDKILSNYEETPSFIKIDVEGVELNVIEGASKTLESKDTSFLIEVGADPDEKDSDADKLFKIFANANYKPYVFEKGNFRLRTKGEKQIDYFFIKNSSSILN